MSKIVKELFIIILLIIVIMFALVILFYDCVSENTEEVVSIEYETNEEVTQVLNEIQKNGSLNTNNENQLVRSYSIDKSDLTINTDEEYNTGKKDPFSKTVDANKDETVSNMQNKNAIVEENNNVTNEIENEVNTNELVKNEVSQTPKVTEDKENSNVTTGTFFENKSSK